jgi:hypothetical protein
MFVADESLAIPNLGKQIIKARDYQNPHDGTK